MKHPFLRLFAVATAFCCPLLSSQLRADQYWNGGDGVWDFGNTPNWSGGTWNSDNQNAIFNSTPGTISVNDYSGAGPVGVAQLLFQSNSTAAWDIESGTPDPTDPTDTTPPSPIYVNGQSALIVQNSGNGNVTIGAGLIVDTTQATDRYNISNDATTLTLGDITFDNTPFTQNGVRSLIIGSGSDSSVINLNGVYKDSSSTGGVSVGLRLAEGGATQDTYYINGDISGLTGGINVASGNVIVNKTANLGTNVFVMYNDQGYSTENMKVLAAQGSTISNAFYVTAKYDSDNNYGTGVLGGSDASLTTFSGNVGLDNSGVDFTEVAGGRVVETGVIGGHSPNGIHKLGAGTVVFATAGGNGYGTSDDFNRINTNVAMDVEQGTLLITNTSGSAFGGNNAATVKVEAGAKLGGSGISAQMAFAVGATSVIAPGDSGADLGTASVATLHLTGGLSALTGLTMDFKLASPGASDALDLAAGDFTLGGTVTVNLSSFGLGAAAGTYTLASGSGGTWSDAGATFNFAAPAGDSVTGYNFDAANDKFTVTIAAPEPSTYAMMIFGAGFLVFLARRKLA